MSTSWYSAAKNGTLSVSSVADGIGLPPVLMAVLVGVTVSLSQLARYAMVPSGAMPDGLLPAGAGSWRYWLPG